MEIDIRDLKNAEDGIDVKDVLTFPDLPAEHTQVESLSPVGAEAHAVLAKGLCEVDGTVDFTVTYHCSRCLEPFESAQRAGIMESFTDDQTRADDDVHFAPQGIVQLDAYIEQSVTLSLEFFPVCKRDCKGLCPVCGVNRNVETCHCETAKVDPRLAVLGDLLSEDKSE